MPGSHLSRLIQMIRHAIFLLLITVFSAANAEKPGRIVSMNLCTDQLLLLLADADKILSVSYLSLQENSSFYVDKVKAAAYPVNHNLPEEVIPLNPDLIVTGQFLHQHETRLLRKLGFRVVTFPVTSSLHDAKNAIRKMAELLGEHERGENIIRQMNMKQEALLTDVSDVTVPAIYYQARGYTQGRDSLLGELIALSGWHNVAQDLAIKGYGQISMEDLIKAQPQQLIVSEYAPGTRSLAQQYLNHPVLARLFVDREPVRLDTRHLICGGPMNLLALEQLIKARNAFN